MRLAWLDIILLSFKAALLFVLFANTHSLLYAAAPDKNTQKQLQDIRTRINVLQKDLAGKKEKKTESMDALRDSERAINSLLNILTQLKRQQSTVQNKLLQLQNQTTELRGVISTEQALLGKLFYYQHLTGEKSYLQLLLNQQDPNKISRKLHYFSYIAQTRSDQINTLNRRQDKLALLTRETQIQNESLQKIHANQLRKKNQLEAEKLKRVEILATLSQEISHQQKKIDELKQGEKRLSVLIKKLNKQIAKQKENSRQSVNRGIMRNDQLPDFSTRKTAFVNLKGKLRLPVRGEIMNRFGSSREGGGVKWQGLFIRSPEGSEVKAIADGQVIFADWLRGFGNLMILNHGNNYMSLYGNNEAIYKRVGNQVRSGDTIAAVGNSGGNPESGLYFELRHQGKPFNPITWVKID